MLSLSDHALAALQSQVDALTEENQSLREQVQPPPEVPGDRYELLRLLDRRQLEVTRLTGDLCTQSVGGCVQSVYVGVYMLPTAPPQRNGPA